MQATLTSTTGRAVSQRIRERPSVGFNLMRAGRNDEIHNNEWLGLNNWWRGRFYFRERMKVRRRTFGDWKDAAEGAPRANLKPAEAVSTC
jgi:hypothetical protein